MIARRTLVLLAVAIAATACRNEKQQPVSTRTPAVTPAQTRSSDDESGSSTRRPSKGATFTSADRLAGSVISAFAILGMQRAEVEGQLGPELAGSSDSGASYEVDGQHIDVNYSNDRAMYVALTSSEGVATAEDAFRLVSVDISSLPQPTDGAGGARYHATLQREIDASIRNIELGAYKSDDRWTQVEVRMW